MYDVKQKHELYRVRIGPPPYRLRFSRDGHRIATGNLSDGNIRILDAVSGNLLHKLTNDDATRVFDWSRNDEFLATSGGSSGKIYVWDVTVSPPRLYRTLDGGHRNSVTQLRFGHSSHFLGEPMCS